MSERSVSPTPMKTPPEEQCWIRTDLGGFITDAERSCHRLLNLTIKGARGKDLLLFFVRNRLDLVGEMRGVVRSGAGSRRVAAEFRPPARRGSSVEVSISPLDPETLEWRFWRIARLPRRGGRPEVSPL